MGAWSYFKLGTAGLSLAHCWPWTHAIFIGRPLSRKRNTHVIVTCCWVYIGRRRRWSTGQLIGFGLWTWRHKVFDCLGLRFNFGEKIRSWQRLGLVAWGAFGERNCLGARATFGNKSRWSKLFRMQSNNLYAFSFCSFQNNYFSIMDRLRFTVLIRILLYQMYCTMLVSNWYVVSYYTDTQDTSPFCTMLCTNIIIGWYWYAVWHRNGEPWDRHWVLVAQLPTL